MSAQIARRAMARALASVTFVVALTCLGACSSGESPEAEPARPAPPRGPASAEPISVRMGGRQVPVRCALGCEDATRELTRLAQGCELDPLSTPHHVSDRPALIHLACCEEAMSAYRQGCGVEAIEACVSRWSAGCSSGARQ